MFGLCGLNIVLICILTRGRFLDDMLVSMAEPSYLFSAGLMNLVIGIAMVVGHNIWDGSWRVVMVFYGWLAWLGFRREKGISETAS